MNFTAIAEVDPAALPDTIWPAAPLDLTITAEIKSTLASDRIVYRATCTVRTVRDMMAWRALSRAWTSDPRVTFTAFTTEGDKYILAWGVDAL
jgi:hypothetical protein